MHLDVGCEFELRDDVNVDISTPKFRINRNFVNADAQHLPFRDEAFEEVTCFHLIEHVENPHKLLKELLRVTKIKATITCPYRFSGYAKSKQHKHYFNKSWFEVELKKLKVKTFKIAVAFDRERDIFCFPLEIVVKIWKVY
jgi:ubiquinone/menaquinone biosynthesis C-methylase UbiE